jgi:hypothetical protein
MQIHEVFEPLRATAGAMLKDPKSFVDPTKYAQARQAGYSASAERSAEKLRAAGVGQPTASQPASQIISQVRNDRAAQQLINTWASQWPKIAANVPPAPPAAPASAASTPPAAQAASFGGQQLDPNDPTTARIMSQLRAQGKINEQQSSAPDPVQYRNDFVKWADDVVERTTRQSGAIARIQQQPNWSSLFSQAVDQVMQTADDPQQNSRAVQEYLTLAVAAARAEHQTTGPQTFTRAGAASGLNDPRADALARALDIDATDVTKLNAFLRRNNETINPQGTGSPSLDALLRAAKLLR